MPRMDGTGPRGLGAGSGRGLGTCGYKNSCSGGFGCRGRRYFASDDFSREALLDQKRALEARLSDIEAHLKG